jgi:mannose-6-phosphate isomerase-like protein (cupin superfamily)
MSIARVAARAGSDAVGYSLVVADQAIQTTSLDYSTPERFVSLRRALGISSFGMNQITLQPGQRGRIHRHDRQEEVYLVMNGRLLLLVEEDEFDLGEGELVRVPAQVRRQLVNRSSSPCTLVAIGADGPHEGRDAEAFEDWIEQHGKPPQEVPLPADLRLP